MARRCSVNKNKGVKVGNNVSHSNRKTKRRYLPNLQVASFFSDILKRNVRLRVSTNSIRTIEHNEGIDKFLINASLESLNRDAAQVRKQIINAQEQQ
jgi:large subunit ribosomal protein L28